MSRLFVVEQNAKNVGGHYFSYTRCVAEAAAALGLEPILLLNRAFKGDWALEGVTTRKAFTFTWGEAENLGRRSWGVGNIAFEFVGATAAEPPRSGDHVLFHTVGFAELIALLDYVTSLPDRSDLPTFHFLLRYDPGYMFDDVATFRPLFERVAASPALRRAVRFHTDTDALSRAFQRITFLPFSTLPIPFEQGHLLAELVEDRPPGPLRFTYLGDARLEKGFGLFPDAIASMRRKRSLPAIRFVLQANFNTPGGETGMLAARDALAAMPDVELICEPLESGAYYAHLAAADAILLPYEARRYAARSSGILIEAMAAGKPVVTSAGSWMATVVAPNHAVVFDEEAGLGTALVELAERHNELLSGARAIADRWKRASTGDAFVRALVATVDPVEVHPQVKRVLVVMNGDAMVLRNGASRIALSQFAYLQKAGYRVAALFLGYDAEDLGGSLDTWRVSVTDRVRGFDFEAVHAMILGEAARLSWRDDPSGPSIAADLAAHRCFVVDPPLRAYLRHHRIDAVLLNYVTSMPVLERLELTDVPIVCEVHDLQSLQKAIYGRRAVSDVDFEMEVAALSRCRHLVSLNIDEARRLGEMAPAVPVTATGVFPPAVSAGIVTLAGCRDLADVATACRPANVLPEAMQRLRARDKIELLFVGSNHLPNVTGLQWFLREVFLPRLAPLEATIVIVGSVTDYETWPQAPGIIYLGRSAEIDPLYAAAQVVLLPIFAGAGSPVKTIEAFQRGTPMVATRHALRGIDPAHWDGVAVAEDTASFCDEILALLADSDLRRRKGRILREAAMALADPGRYDMAMDSVFADVFGLGAPRVAARSGSSGSVGIVEEALVVEWSPELAFANGLVRDAIAGDAPYSEAAAGMQPTAGMQQTSLRALVECIVEALVEKQTAPILRADPSLLRAVAAADPSRVLAAAMMGLRADPLDR